MKKAIIIGHSGQDGTLLCESLEHCGYSVWGVGRSSLYSTNGYFHTANLDITNIKEIYDLIDTIKPEEIYYLAAYHTSSEATENISTKKLFDISQQTHVTGLVNCLCAIRDLLPSCKLFYASSSLVFSGENGEIQDEKTALSPKGFYAITKAQGMWLCREFRECFGVFASVGILYNHESHLRRPSFLSQKIIQAAIRIASGSKEKLVVGDLSARVDWGYAPDFVNAFQEILKLDISQDFIVATGEAHSVREFIEIAFGHFGLDPNAHIVEDESILLRRPLVKIGNPSKLRQATGWKCSLGFSDLVNQLIIESQCPAISMR